MKRGWVAASLAVFIFYFSPSAQAEIFNVTITTDPTPDPTADPCSVGDCSLREAVISSNANSEDNTILLQDGPYLLTRSGSDEDVSGQDAAFGDLDILKAGFSLTISGTSAAASVIDADGLGDRILDLCPNRINCTLNLNNLTLQNGDAGSGDGGAVAVSRDPTGMAGNGSNTLQVSHCRLLNNHAAFGGAVWGVNHDSIKGVNLNRSVLSNNTATAEGGAIWTSGAFAVTVNDSTVSENHADLDGGGIRTNGAPIRATNTTFSGNTAVGSGGAILLSSNLMMINNSTFSGNEANDGGAWSMGFCNTFVRSTTMTANTASDQGGGVFINGGCSLDIENSILADNSSGTGSEDCFDDTGGSFNLLSGGYNVYGEVSSCGTPAGPDDQNNVPDVGLGPLADNGGPTFTHAVLGGSPALDNGNPSGCREETDGNGLTTDAILTTDQRGQNRILGGRCDSGAFEAGSTLCGDGICSLTEDCSCSDCQDLPLCLAGSGEECGDGICTVNEDCTCSDCAGEPSCLGSGGGECSDGICAVNEDCTCSDCADDPTCQPGGGGECGDDICAVPEDCSCSDCADDPSCQPGGGGDDSGQTPPPASGGCQLSALHLGSEAYWLGLLLNLGFLFLVRKSRG